MARVGPYHTRQGDVIESYLAAHGDKHITAEQVAAHLDESGTPVGLATVYRHLDKLERSGLVRKLVVSGVPGACYQYASDGGGFHLMCADCGKLVRLDCREAADFERHVLCSHDFQIHSAKTVLYGKCASCAKNN